MLFSAAVLQQTALSGMLLRIRTLGLTLRSLSSDEAPENEKERSVSSDLPVEA
jgi:hypothetical protein